MRPKAWLDLAREIERAGTWNLEEQGEDRKMRCMLRIFDHKI
jgi:hypothetical protein